MFHNIISLEIFLYLVISIKTFEWTSLHLIGRLIPFSITSKIWSLSFINRPPFFHKRNYFFPKFIIHFTHFSRQASRMLWSIWVSIFISRLVSLNPTHISSLFFWWILINFLYFIVFLLDLHQSIIFFLFLFI